MMGNDPFQVIKALFSLVDPYHPLGSVKVNPAKCIPDQVTGFFFFIRRNCIFKVEDDPIRAMDTGIDHQAWGIARQV